MKNIVNKVMKPIVSLLVAGGLFFSACSPIIYKHQRYEGEFGGEKLELQKNITYHKNVRLVDNVLIVKKPDGTAVKYEDWLFNDFKLDYVEIIEPNGQKKGYSFFEPLEKPFVIEAQKKFDVYLQKIKEKNVKDGLEKIN